MLFCHLTISENFVYLKPILLRKEETYERIFKGKAHQLPLTPGVYLMKDATDTIIYVGKAKN